MLRNFITHLLHFSLKRKMDQRLSYLLFVSQGIALSLIIGVKSEPMVQMGDTKIWGDLITFEDCDVEQYLGIPYAEPPLDDLRFQKTKPLETFPEEFEAYYPPPACRQYTETPYPWYFNDPDRSEDCLYLNIWKPAGANPQNLKPVMVWLHSGNYKFGSISLDHHSGVPLAALGDIIVVTFNYRLGIFGFLSSNTDEAPGNAGLWDIFEALKFINKYIKDFGGDPTQITFAGESTAANVIGYFTLKDDTQKLYSQMILQSGSPVNFQTNYNKQNLEIGKKIAKMAGCEEEDLDEMGPDTVKCLKDVSADDLEDMEFKLSPNSTYTFHPITGDKFLPANPRKSILNGNFHGKPLLIGSNRDEGSIMVPILDMNSFGVHGEKNVKIDSKMVVKMINILLKILPDFSMASSGLSSLQKTPAITANPLIKKLSGAVSAVTAPVPIDKMPAGLPDVGSLLSNSIIKSSSNSDCMRRKLHKALGDIVMVCPSVYFAEKCAEQGNDVYYYFYVHQASNSPYAPWMGVTHFSEVPFVFGLPLTSPDEYTDEEKDLSRQLINYWSGFVTSGKPDSSWPKYSADNPTYKVIGGKHGSKDLGKGPHKRNCDLLRPASKLL